MLSLSGFQVENKKRVSEIQLADVVAEVAAQEAEGALELIEEHELPDSIVNEVQ